MKNFKTSKNPKNLSSFLVSTEVKCHRTFSSQGAGRTIYQLILTVQLSIFQVFELGPSLYVVELKKAHGDSTLYRQVPMHIRAYKLFIVYII
jgi:hypothetical protein